jgi:hypothetical protein
MQLTLVEAHHIITTIVENKGDCLTEIAPRGLWKKENQAPQAIT